MNYTELVAAAKAYADRYDTEVSDNIPTFVLFAEARINRKLRVREMSTHYQIPTVTDQESYALPTDFLSMRSIYIDNGGAKIPMTLSTPQEADNYTSIEGPGGGYYYLIKEDKLFIAPTQDTGSDIELTYYQRVTPINGSNATNWMSDDYPDVYLAAMMYEIEAFVKNADGAAAWKGRFDEAISEISLSDGSDRWSGTPISMRVG